MHGLLNFQARRPNSNVAIRLLVLSLVASCYTYCIAPHHNLELNLYTSYPPVRLTAPLFRQPLVPFCSPRVGSKSLSSRQSTRRVSDRYSGNQTIKLSPHPVRLPSLASSIGFHVVEHFASLLSAFPLPLLLLIVRAEGAEVHPSACCSEARSTPVTPVTPVTFVDDDHIDPHPLPILMCAPYVWSSAR